MWIHNHKKLKGPCCHSWSMDKRLSSQRIGKSWHGVNLWNQDIIQEEIKSKHTWS